MTTDRADEIIEELASFLEELRRGQPDTGRLGEISAELTAIEVELDIPARV